MAPPNTPAAAWRIALALGLVYVVWGTTYYAVAVAVREMSPLWMNASRFALAGVLMLGIARATGQAWPTAAQWRHCALVGVLMAGVAMTCVTFAQRLGIGSGLMATVVTTMPMWLALWTHLGGERVSPSAWLGLALGVSGAVLLTMERDFSATALGGLLAFAAPLAWSLGSYASRKLAMPGHWMAPGAQWLVGGSVGLVAAAAFESPEAMLNASATAWATWVYLLLFGTMTALSAYLWLLRNTTAALAGSYSFVNPAVALAVGVWFGRESVNGWVWLALPLILAALGLILYGPKLGLSLPGRSSAKR
jgi:drug/metabolite transporter (DMT)-like permease